MLFLLQVDLPFETVFMYSTITNVVTHTQHEDGSKVKIMSHVQ